MGRRAIPPRLATLPPPLMAQITAGGSVRLTPSIRTRQPPMPILNLPLLPPPTPTQPVRPTRPTAPLRSLPALPRQGPSEADQEATHDNSSLEEEDEDEDGDGDEPTGSPGREGESDGSGDEDDYDPGPRSAASYIGLSSAGPSSAGPSRFASLPPVDTSGFSVFFGDAGLQGTPHVSPSPNPSIDYFNSKPLEPPFSPMRTPRPIDFRPNSMLRGLDRIQLPRIIPMPATPVDSPRPTLYHHASKSMIDLDAMTRKGKNKIVTPKLGGAPTKKLQNIEVAAPVEQLPPSDSPDDVIQSPMLKRRRSLQVYEPSSDPPPYPDPVFSRHSKVPAYQPPHEDEGREELPRYSNAIFFAGPMPRKMEFVRPGVQAKDRKWRRVYCVLEGTALRVYRCPPEAAGVSAIEHWWESKVGVGDVTSISTTAATRQSPTNARQHEEEPTERIPKIVEEPPEPLPPPPVSASASPRPSREPSPVPSLSRSRLGIASRFLRKQRSKSLGRLEVMSGAPTASRRSMDARQEGSRPPMSTPPAAGRHSFDVLGASRPSISSASTHASSSTSTSASTSASGRSASTGLTVPPTPPSASSASSMTSSTEGMSRFSRSRLLSHLEGRGDKGKERERGQGREGKGKECGKDAQFMPEAKDLLRQYSLQNAESGLASDYQKRKNVVRVRMEGEQFLLQATDVTSVVEWIEVSSAAPIRMC